MIGGLQKVTLLDFPGKVACAVFLTGCNLRCPYCHNPELVLPRNNGKPVSENELFEFLFSRKGKLDGVCITGGEPTLYPSLPDLIRRIREMGFLVKLDSNGTLPEMLEHLLREELLDYVAIDIKNAPSRYAEICGADVIEQVKKSAAMLKTAISTMNSAQRFASPFIRRNAWKKSGAGFVAQSDIISSHLSIPAICSAAGFPLWQSRSLRHC